MNAKRFPFERLVSGGQTGVDRAALDLALRHGIPCGGWCPKGRLAEDGAIDEKYPLKETATAEFAERTELNARDSDGTLIITEGEPKDGTPLTETCANKYNKPLLTYSLDESPDPDQFDSWIHKYDIKVLNVAGPRESHAPGRIYRESQMFLSRLFRLD